MNDEIGDLKAALDLLIARSMAQEGLLMFLMQHSQWKERHLTVSFDVDRTLNQMRDLLRHSSLTDAQIALYEREQERMLQRLRTWPEPGIPDLPF